jgi:hypothetical protein
MSSSALVFAYGPEIRSFLGGGLAEELALEGPVILISAFPQSTALASQSYPIIELSCSAETTSERLMRRYISSIVERRMLLHGALKWRHQIAGSGNQTGWKERMKSVLSAPPSLKLLGAAERWLGGVAPADIGLEKTLRAHKVTRLFYSAYNDVRTNVVVRTANRLGIKTIAIPNSWKDVYVRPRVSPAPSELRVWDEETRSRFLSLNPDLTEHSVVVTPSLHLAAVLRQRGMMDRGTFCRRSGLDPDCAFVCYTTATQKAVVDEERTVRAIAESFQSAGTRAVQLLVRVNPMEAGHRFEDALAGLRNVAVQRPAWEWHPEQDWCAASTEDTLTWAATLEHMHLNISVPSTVTLEALAFGKQVFNVGFDCKSDLPAAAAVRRYWDAPFYRRFHDHAEVRLAESLKALVAGVSASVAEAVTTGAVRSAAIEAVKA